MCTQIIALITRQDRRCAVHIIILKRYVGILSVICLLQILERDGQESENVENTWETLSVCVCTYVQDKEPQKIICMLRCDIMAAIIVVLASHLAGWHSLISKTPLPKYSISGTPFYSAISRYWIHCCLAQEVTTDSVIPKLKVYINRTL